MNMEYVSEAIGGIDTRFIVEAERTESRKRTRAAWAGAAACLLLAAFTTFFAVYRRPSSGPGGSFPMVIIKDPFGNMGGAGGRIEFEIPAEKIPQAENMNVWRVIEAEPDEKIAARIAELFGASSPDIRKGEDGCINFIEKGITVIFTPGRLNASRETEHGFEKEKLFDDEEYVERAKSFLREIGLSASGFDLDGPIVGENGLTSNGEFEFVDVTFPHKAVDGLDEILGAPSFICVELTVSGSVVGIDAGLYEFHHPIQFPILSAEEVIRLYEEDPENVLFYDSCPAEGGIAAEVRLSWMIVPEYFTGNDYENGMNLFRTYECRWMIPVWVFRGETEEGSFIAVMRAVPEKYLVITPEIPIGG